MQSQVARMYGGGESVILRSMLGSRKSAESTSGRQEPDLQAADSLMLDFDLCDLFSVFDEQ
ncbi:hypothetical protein N7534_007623 [Penicillium rubens]|nr:hypothetical protein N7534_007623 [Penicillium rubens]